MSEKEQSLSEKKTIFSKYGEAKHINDVREAVKRLNVLVSIHYGTRRFREHKASDEKELLDKIKEIFGEDLT